VRVAELLLELLALLGAGVLLQAVEQLPVGRLLDQ
jgi:hypothetical protein